MIDCQSCACHDPEPADARWRFQGALYGEDDAEEEACLAGRSQMSKQFGADSCAGERR